MKTSLKRSVVAHFAASSLVLGACGSNGSSNSSSNGSGSGTTQIADYNKKDRSDIKDGGELHLSISELSAQENAFQADSTAYTSTIWSLYNPQLAMFTPDGEYSPNSDYLTDVKDEVKDGKTIVTFTIRDEAKFNDGTPIDWTAFENTWKANSGQDSAYNVSSTNGYNLIESVTQGTTAKQAVVTFKQPDPWWKGLFNILVPPQVKDAQTFNEGYLNKLHPEWGAGPFTVDSVDFNKGIVSFKRNPNWWGDKAKLDKITYRQMEDQASLNALKAGEIDAASTSTKDRLETAKKMGDQVQIRTGAQPFTALITLNSKSSFLSDAKVRQAIMTGIDRSQLAQIRFNGLDYSEKLPGSFIQYQSQKGYQDNFGSVVSFDKDKAKKILEDDGWKAGSDGIMAKDGKKLELRYTLLGDNPVIKAGAVATQKMLKDIGVQIDIVERPSSDFSAVATKQDFDIFPMGYSSSDPYGVAYFRQTYGSDSQLNRSGTGTPEFDQKISELEKLPTADEQLKRGNELEKEALSTYGIMPINNGPQIVAVKPKLANFGPKNFGNVKPQDIGWEK